LTPRVRTVLGVLFLNLFLLAASSLASDKPDKNAKPATSVDSGSFGILVNGKRLATESFRVEQRADYSSVSSELKFNDANMQALQSSELQMLPSGLLKKYTWKEVKPGKSQIIVEPQDESFLVSHMMASPTDPAKDTVHPLAPSTSILDDNFFSHMEVLAWKYMAANCRTTLQNQTECRWQTQRLPVYVPHQQASMIVQIQFTGASKMKLNGVDADVNSFKMQGDAGEWLLWFNLQNKLVRVLMLADNTEVLRD
jgi:hypothetical protein